MVVPRLTSVQVRALRMRSLNLTRDDDRPVPDVSRVVRHGLAMQAQDFAASRWAIGCRMPEAVDADVLAAYDAGRIVRSWPMRGTVHAVCAEDLPWLLTLTGIRALSPAVLAGRWARLGVSEGFIERAREVAIRRLRGGGRITRPELATVMADAGLDVGGQVMYHVVWYLAITGTLVQGPMIGTRHGLVLMDEWIAKPRRLSRDDALRELVVRYTDGHGPATLDDMAWWSGLTKSDLRAGIEHAGDMLEPAVHAGSGRELYMRAGSQEPPSAGARRARVRTFALPAFDEHLLGYRHRDDVLGAEHSDRVNAGANGVFPSTIVRGGRVVATWRVTRRARGVEVGVDPLVDLTAAARREVDRALARWSRFTGAQILATSFAG